MARLRVALFGSSTHYSARALRELAASHDVVAAVRPSWPGIRRALRDLAHFGPPAPLEACARELGVPIVDASGMGERLREHVRALRPDVIAIALFPKRVPAEVTALAALGAINLHPSLLPRHRGPLPLFWTYHCDDRAAGVTVHHATDRLDAGDVILQEAFELPRAYPVATLDRDVAIRGASLLRRAVDALASSTAPRVPQDESAATQAPLIEAGACMARLDEWDVERAWHFLAGLCPAYREPLADERGRRIDYRAVAGYRRCDPSLAPGRVERTAGALLLHCRGGVVELVEAPR